MYDFPPEGIEYCIPETNKRVPKYYKLYRRIKTFSILMPLVNKIVRMLFKYEESADCELIHFIQFVPDKIPNIPYVIDFEHVAGLTDFLDTWNLKKENIQKFLENKNCVGILPMSNAALDTFKETLGEGFFNKIKDKVRIIYPSLSIKNNKIEEDRSVISNPRRYNILFVGNHVYRKGLHILLKAFVRFPVDEYNLYIISDIDKSLKEKYLRENIFFFAPKFSREEILGKFFAPADLFVMPTFYDTFGMVFLDALITGTPIVATNIFAIPEIVENNKNGILIDLEEDYITKDPYLTNNTMESFKEMDYGFVNSVYENILKIERSKSIKNYAKKSSKDYFFDSNGKFSIQRRNRLLKEIYEKAVEIS